jgi:hypothetical protein
MQRKNNPPEALGREISTLATVRLTWDAERLPELLILLSRGVMIKTRLDSSLRSVLCRELGTNREFLLKRVSAAFLDGKTVDDLDSAMLAPGSTVALTGCLTEPFLLHAFSQRWFPPETHEEKSQFCAKSTSPAREGFITLKILNVLIQDFGPHLLESGVWLDTKSLEAFFASRSSRFWTGLKTAKVDEAETDSASLAQGPWSKEPGLVKLRVEAVN